MPHIAERPLLTALALSLVVHVLMLWSTGHFDVTGPTEIGFPIEASLLPPTEPEQAVAQPQAKPEPQPSPPKPMPEQVKPVPPEPVPVNDTAPLPVEVPQPKEPAAPPPVPVPVETKPEPVAIPPAAPTVQPEPEKPSIPLRLAKRGLPGQFEIRYGVHYGEGGFKAGVARYIWQSGKGRYSLVSTLEASGLASLFVSGRIVQLSEGELDSSGLKPAQYWLQQGEKRQDAARFLWPQNQLVLGSNRGSVELTPQAQDLLSFPFQLAMTAREDEVPFGMGISNGRKFQQYAFRVIGLETMEITGRKVDCLHLLGERTGSGMLEVWLERGGHGLPLQIRTLDQKGKQVTMSAEEVIVR